nr:hypothetical protein [Nocardia brasiliensis]
MYSEAPARSASRFSSAGDTRRGSASAESGTPWKARIGLRVHTSAIVGSSGMLAATIAPTSEEACASGCLACQRAASASHGPAPNQLRHSAALNCTRSAETGCGSPNGIRYTWLDGPSTTVAKAGTGAYPSKLKA